MEEGQSTKAESSKEGQKEREIVGDPSLKVCLMGMDKWTSKKDLANWLKSINVPCVRSKKIAGQQFAYVMFENAEERDKWIPVLAQNKMKGRTLKVEVSKRTLITAAPKRERERDSNENESKRAKREGGGGALEEDEDGAGRSRGDTKGKKEFPSSICDVITPWWIHSYEKQLLLKEGNVRHTLRALAKAIRRESHYNVPEWVKKHPECCPLEPIHPSKLTQGYRNKVSFAIGTDTNGQVCIGFNLGKLEHGIDALASPNECPSVSEHAKVIRNHFQSFLEGHLRGDLSVPKPSGQASVETYPPLQVYNKYTHVGFWRQLVVRTYSTGEAMSILQVNPAGLDQDQLQGIKRLIVEYSQRAIDQGVNLGSLVWQEFEGISNFAPIETPHQVLIGREQIHEKLFDLTFRISPSAFFQVNTPTAETLYGLIREWCKVDKNTTILDICCGTGTIGLTLARDVKRVIGVEMDPKAIQDALVNMKLNGITNSMFIPGKAEDVLGRAIKLYVMNNEKCVAVVDPPRAGLHPDVVRAIRACPMIQTVIFVSCDKSGLLSNGAMLCRSKSGSLKGDPFVPVKAACVDMFPHTDNVEIVVLFERANNNNNNSKKEDVTKTSTSTSSTSTAADPTPSTEIKEVQS